MSSTNSAVRLWALVDCNNFYASCERLFRPDLAHAPIVVLSNNDGCIVSRSNEAKALGIGMVPEFSIRSFLRQHNVAVFSSNYALYGDISSRVMLSLESVMPDVETYSIDEAFLPVREHLSRSGTLTLGKKLRQRVLQWTGIPASVGIGTTRTLAKLAAGLAKKQGGVYVVEAGKDETTALLEQTAVGELWGIGHKMALRLRSHGIHTARDLRDADNRVVLSLLTVTGLHTALELRGISCIGTELPVPRRTLVSSRSFGQPVGDKQSLLQAASLHAARAAERLRREGLTAMALSVHIRTSRHTDRKFSAESVINFLSPSSSTDIFIRAARQGVEEIFSDGYRYAKVGIVIFGLGEECQPSLFDLLDEEKSSPGAVTAHGDRGDPHGGQSRAANKRLMAVLDTINKQYGQDTLRYGACGQREESWHMRQQYRSPRYTTRWDELPIVR